MVPHCNKLSEEVAGNTGARHEYTSDGTLGIHPGWDAEHHPYTYHTLIHTLEQFSVANLPTSTGESIVQPGGNPWVQREYTEKHHAGI